MRTLQYFTLVVISVFINSSFAAGDYFPNGFDPFWYSKNLEALEEPSLFLKRDEPNLQIYRFTWLRTFHHPISVRLEINKDMAGILYTKVTSGAAGYDPGRLMTNESKPTKKDEVAYFLNLIEGERFWKLPTRMQQITPDGTIIVGKDGAQWILEGLSGGNYHVVDRWSPKNGSVRKLSLYLLKLSGLKVDDIDIY